MIFSRFVTFSCVFLIPKLMPLRRVYVTWLILFIIHACISLILHRSHVCNQIIQVSLCVCKVIKKNPVSFGQTPFGETAVRRNYLSDKLIRTNTTLPYIPRISLLHSLCVFGGVDGQDGQTRRGGGGISPDPNDEQYARPLSQKQPANP